MGQLSGRERLQVPLRVQQGLQGRRVLQALPPVAQGARAVQPEVQAVQVVRPRGQLVVRQVRELGEGGAGDVVAGRAEAFQHRDGPPLGVQVGLHGIADADAADQQRGQPDQDQENPQPFDEAFDTRCAAAAVAYPPALVGEALFQRGDETGQGGPGGGGGVSEAGGSRWGSGARRS